LSFFIKEFMRGHWNIRKQHQECVRRRASISLFMNPSCYEKKGEIKEIIEEVFETCLSDTQPFDRIP